MMAEDDLYVVKQGDFYLRLMLVPGCGEPAIDWVPTQRKATLFSSKDDVRWLQSTSGMLLRYVRIRRAAAPSERPAAAGLGNGAERKDGT